METATASPVSIASPRLADALRAVLPTMPGVRCTRPVLQNVLMEHDGAGTLHLTATDLETVCTVTATGGAGEPSRFLVPGAAAKAASKAKAAATLTYTENDGGTPFVGTGGVAYAVDWPVEEFPAGHPRPAESALVCRLSWRAVCTIAEHIANATDDESSRYALGSVAIERGDGVTVAVGTDGRRLHALTVPADGVRSCHGPAEETAAYVPAWMVARFVKAVSAIAGAGRKAGRARLEVDGACVAVYSTPDAKGPAPAGSVNAATVALEWIDGDGSSVLISTRTRHGRFPRWRDCVCKATEGETGTLEPAGAVAAIRAAGAVTTEQNKGVTIAVDCGGVAVLSAYSTVGHYSAPFVSATLPPYAKTTLLPRFAVEAIEACAAVGDVVAMQFSRGVGDIEASAGAILFRAGTPGSMTIDTVVMPLAAA